MKERWRRFLVFAIVVLVFSINLFLLGKNSTKADRLNYISSWKELTAGDLVDVVRTEGVVAPSERQPIFIDSNVTFKEFLVDKGDKVENGTPLFEYGTEDLDGQIALLDAEIKRLEKEKKSIEVFVRDLERKKTSLPGNRVNTRSVFAGDSEIEAVIDAVSSIETARQARELREIDQSIAEKKLELEKVDFEIDMYEEQRSVVESGRSGLTMLSPYEGIVEDISYELNNPVITIVSDDLFVEGTLSEKEVREVEEGMRVDIHSDLLEDSLAGQVGMVSELPAERAAVERTSLYPFTVVLGEEDVVLGENDADLYDENTVSEDNDAVLMNEDEDIDEEDAVLNDVDEDIDEKDTVLNKGDSTLYAGYHVHADIVVDEALNVPVVRSNHILNKDERSYLWILNREGLVEKRVVELGLQVEQREEIKTGAELGELYATHPNEIDVPGPFITPYKGGKFILNEWEKASFRKKLKYVLVGVLQR
ncbi:HlyD family efflux transporter periplasmic adaptor subunit [Lederbergia wuyishanensis]|uniref:HlyD family secretion protein n=1 Tax=Lederbergia wuyishanensis TaxID=1347903 RepID=A0ABU0D392_9BACI|nr:HlyD family efflux transporter periplasmic adaptor subunit [Lederbergia wuyishanensis]MCJ8007958.1 HlyD family efflux transporter periplasmic adaptor subunit [Lederbergia wuyishanensis]MDQ0342872.1 HlyD family secretion protein [Lederbergia wuyishanensis]